MTAVGPTLTWLGIFLGALTLFATLSPLFQLSNWASYLVEISHYERPIWNFLLAWSGIRVQPAIASTLSFATSQFFVATGCLLQLAKLSSQGLVGQRSFLYGVRVPDPKKLYEHRVRFYWNALAIFVVGQLVFISVFAYAASLRPTFGMRIVSSCIAGLVLVAGAFIVFRWTRRMAYILVTGSPPIVFSEGIKTVGPPSDSIKEVKAEAEYWLAEYLIYQVARGMRIVYGALVLAGLNYLWFRF